MTITMTNSATQAATNVKKSALDKAINLARKEDSFVCIYKAEIVKGNGKMVLSATKVQFDESPMRHELELIATIDQNGNFVD